MKNEEYKKVPTISVEQLNTALNRPVKIHADRVEPVELERIPLSKWDKPNGAAEGLAKKMGYWQQKDLDITIAQSINLAQNQVLKEIDKGDTELSIFYRIEQLYSKYLELLLEAKSKHNPKDDEKDPL